MEMIPWDPTLETGDATVDGQHRELISIINDLTAAERDGHDRSVVASTLERLASYTATHFACEEHLMARHGVTCPAHIAEHRLLTEKTREFVLAYRTGEGGDVASLVEFLTAWLSVHINQVDRSLVRRIREQSRN